VLTQEQYNKLAPFKLALRAYVETEINVGMDNRKLLDIYHEIDPHEKIDYWCSGCVDVIRRRCYDLIKEYEAS